MAAFLMVGCVCTDCKNDGGSNADSLELFVDKYEVQTNYVFDGGHTYVAYKSYNKYMGLVHDPECVCEGGARKDTASIKKYMEEHDIRTGRFTGDGHLMVVFFELPHKWCGTAHDPDCPCAKTEDAVAEDDIWNTEIEIDW